MSARCLALCARLRHVPHAHLRPIAPQCRAPVPGHMRLSPHLPVTSPLAERRTPPPPSPGAWRRTCTLTVYRRLVPPAGGVTGRGNHHRAARHHLWTRRRMPELCRHRQENRELTLPHLTTASASPCVSPMVRVFCLFYVCRSSCQGIAPLRSSHAISCEPAFEACPFF